MSDVSATNVVDIAVDRLLNIIGSIPDFGNPEESVVEKWGKTFAMALVSG
jgi:hypothetical protein